MRNLQRCVTRSVDWSIESYEYKHVISIVGDQPCVMGVTTIMESSGKSFCHSPMLRESGCLVSRYKLVNRHSYHWASKEKLRFPQNLRTTGESLIDCALVSVATELRSRLRVTFHKTNFESNSPEMTNSYTTPRLGSARGSY